MDDSLESSASQGAPWVLFIHRLPPKPDYLRVKVQRRLRKLGAVALKNSVYVLPNSDESQEDFHWLAEEIRADGGTAMICEATFIGGISNAEVRAMLGGSSAAVSEMRGRVWVTRAGVKVDRMASAWLIRRFIDPEATFRFVNPRTYQRVLGETTFDMVRADFGHHGDRCTFEGLAEAFVPGDRALRAIGEIVHDLDLKDDRYRRPETAGIATLIRGIVDATFDDNERLARGAELFERLYTSLT
jgi:hypothetical protein